MQRAIARAQYFAVSYCPGPGPPSSMTSGSVFALILHFGRIEYDGPVAIVRNTSGWYAPGPCVRRGQPPE